MITKGARVSVYPHGSPDKAATGKVILISDNQRSIAVGFDAMPPFAFRDGSPIGFHPRYGVVMLAGRAEIDGKPWGPWIELAGGHYEIEEPMERVDD